MRTTLFVAFLVSALAIAQALSIPAISYEPAPSIGNGESRPPKPNANGHQAPTGSHQPAAIVTLPNARTDAGQGDKKASPAANQQEDKAASDWWLVFWTGMLVTVTGLLVIVTSVQVVLFFWQLKLIRSSLVDTKTAADAAKKAADTSYEAFVRLERPWLFLDFIGIKRRDVSGPPIPNFFWIDLRFKNLGRAPAIITACTFKFSDKAQLPDQPDYTGFQMLSTEITVSPDQTAHTDPIGPGDKRTEELVMYGFISYEGLGGGKYITGYAVEISQLLPASGGYGNKNYTYYK